MPGTAALRYVTKTLSAAWPAWKSHQSRPGFSILTTPSRWHCSHTLSRRLGANLAGFTMDPGAGSLRCAAGEPWHRSQEIGVKAGLPNWFEVPAMKFTEPVWQNRQPLEDARREDREYVPSRNPASGPSFWFACSMKQAIDTGIAPTGPCSCIRRCRPPPNTLLDTWQQDRILHLMLEQRAARLDSDSASRNLMNDAALRKNRRRANGSAHGGLLERGRFRRGGSGRRAARRGLSRARQTGVWRPRAGAWEYYRKPLPTKWKRPAERHALPGRAVVDPGG